MAKKGMSRPDRTHVQPRNEVPPVPQIQGKAKHGKQHAYAGIDQIQEIVVETVKP